MGPKGGGIYPAGRFRVAPWRKSRVGQVTSVAVMTCRSNSKFYASIVVLYMILHGLQRFTTTFFPNMFLCKEL